MSEERYPNFLFVPEPEKLSMLNLDQVRMVDEIREDHCRLHFDELI